MPLPTTPGACIRCDKPIAWLSQDERSTNLNDAIDLSGTGSYGSGWDSVPRLTIYLCDDCIQERGRAGQIHQWGDDGNLHVWDPQDAFGHAREDLGI
jgi:hypothetical protein